MSKDLNLTNSLPLKAQTDEELDDILFLSIPESVINYEALRRSAKRAIFAWSNRRVEEAVKEADGNVSDGFHTFNELYCDKCLKQPWELCNRCKPRKQKKPGQPAGKEE